MLVDFSISIFSRHFSIKPKLNKTFLQCYKIAIHEWNGNVFLSNRFDFKQYFNFFLYQKIGFKNDRDKTEKKMIGHFC